MEAVKLENVFFRYENCDNYVLSDISLTINQGEFVAITGATAAGKSTLCMCFNGLIPNFVDGKFKGKVTVNGKNTKQVSTASLAKEVGIVFQNPESQLYGLTIEEEVVFALENYGFSKEDIKDRLEWALNAVGMYKYRKKSPFELSGGQKQRVIIASTLALRPNILVLDEPTAEIDPIGKNEVFRLITQLREKENMTIIIVEHETERIASYADRVIMLEGGRITRDTDTKTFFQDIEYLRKNGVKPPQVCELFNNLKEKGVYCGQLPVNIEDGEKELRKILAGEGVKQDASN